MMKMDWAVMVEKALSQMMNTEVLFYTETEMESGVKGRYKGIQKGRFAQKIFTGEPFYDFILQ
jgi:hypothetical protein